MQHENKAEHQTFQLRNLPNNHREMQKNIKVILARQYEKQVDLHKSFLTISQNHQPDRKMEEYCSCKNGQREANFLEYNDEQEAYG